MVDADFKNRVYSLVALIPDKKVMTYGQIAAYCGEANAAWQVGQIAHLGPVDLPWHRVVNKQGGLARGWPGGIGIQKALLEAEGVFVDENYKVDIHKLNWLPK